MHPSTSIRFVIPREESADKILQTLFKHPYIDNTKPTVICDFLTPIATEVIATDTDVGAEDPLDLTTLKYMLVRGDCGFILLSSF